MRAYLKRWGKVIFLSFILGFLLILFLFLGRNAIYSFIPAGTETVGITGDYPADEFPNNLPDEILNKTSKGLTKVQPNGEISPDVAERWDVKDDGKTFIFYLNDELTFSDGEEIDSNLINYNFTDATIERPAKSVIIFKLKDKYSPFLVTVANRKVFTKDLVGVSSYRIKDVETQDGFVRSIELESKSDKKKLKYYFYPTQTALKDAYVLGDVSKIIDINNLNYNEKADFADFNNTIVTKQANKNKIATVFINNSDSVLSDKKIRKALAYSMPDKFAEGERAYSPYKKDFWAYNPSVVYKKDLEYAKLQLEDSEGSSDKKIKVKLKALRQYRVVAEEIAKNWKKIGIETEIEIVDGVPNVYQAFLGELPVLKDPDQYTLWHTGQPSNITNYRNLRIDKLLEDGRTTYDMEDRKKIYDDFQKYLVDDMPAIFLYFPYTYTLTRK